MEIRVGDVFDVDRVQWKGTLAPRRITRILSSRIEYTVPQTGEEWTNMAHDELDRYLRAGLWRRVYDARMTLPEGV